MDEKRRTRVSKYLSKYLRHSPEALNLTLEPGGWVFIEDLLSGADQNGFPITRDELNEVVAKCAKQRFSMDDETGRIRANQGHSTEVDLQLEVKAPPDILYHGTASQFVAIILSEGLSKMKRHHVHLFDTPEQATIVGGRRGKPVVLSIDAKAMVEQDFEFFCSANGVWLVDHVPINFLQAPTPPEANTP